MKSCHEIILAAAIPLGPEMTSRAIQLNLLNRDFELENYRGFDVLTALDRMDSDYSLLVKEGTRSDVLSCIAVEADQGIVRCNFPTREEAIRCAHDYVDRWLAMGKCPDDPMYLL